MSKAAIVSRLMAPGASAGPALEGLLGGARQLLVRVRMFDGPGAADLLEVAWLIALAAQLDDARALTRGICDGRDEVQAGAEASFVLVRGSSLAQVLAERPGERVVLRRGVRISP